MPAPVSAYQTSRPYPGSDHGSGANKGDPSRSDARQRGGRGDGTSVIVAAKDRNAVFPNRTLTIDDRSEDGAWRRAIAGRDVPDWQG